MDRSELDRRLWRRLQEEEAPDALLLAAYAEGRLAPEEAARVEALLAKNPELGEDVAFARAGAAEADPAAAERVAARAMALVAEPSATVVPFRPRPVRRWAEALALAASLVLCAYLGFEMGASAQTAEVETIDIFDGVGFVPSYESLQL
jgi:anti-sigma factor RsiW